jgi:hypothetical protein
MNWATLIPIIVRYGVPYAYDFWKIVTTHTEPTEEAWQKLLALSEKSYSSYISDAQARAGGTPP